MTPNVVQLTRQRLSASFPRYHYRSHQYEVGGRSVVRQLFHFFLVSIAPFRYQRPRKGPEIYLIPSDGGETISQNHNSTRKISSHMSMSSIEDFGEGKQEKIPFKDNGIRTS